MEDRLAITLSSPRLKNIVDCDAGELVLIPYAHGTALGIVLQPFNDEVGKYGFGYLTGPDKAKPHCYFSDSTGQCASYGNNWVLEPLSLPAFPAGYLERQSGDVLITEDGPSIYFHDQKAGRGWMHMLISSFMPLNVDAGTLPIVSSWRIWESREALLALDSAPLFEHGDREQAEGQ